MAIETKEEEILSALQEKAQSRFECQVCGTCCQGEGGIYLNPEEEKRIAEFLGLPVEVFYPVFAWRRMAGSIFTFGKPTVIVILRWKAGAPSMRSNPLPAASGLFLSPC